MSGEELTNQRRKRERERKREIATNLRMELNSKDGSRLVSDAHDRFRILSHPSRHFQLLRKTYPKEEKSAQRRRQRKEPTTLSDYSLFLSTVKLLYVTISTPCSTPLNSPFPLWLTLVFCPWRISGTNETEPPREVAIPWWPRQIPRMGKEEGHSLMS